MPEQEVPDALSFRGHLLVSVSKFNAAAIIKLRAGIEVVENEERKAPLFSFTMSLAEE